MLLELGARGPGWEKGSISVDSSKDLCRSYCWEAVKRLLQAVLISEILRLLCPALRVRAQNRAGHPVGAQ